MSDQGKSDRCLGGRSARASDPLTQHWFAEVPTLPITFVDLGTQWRPSNDGPTRGDCRLQLWRIDSSVRERQRFANTGDPPLTLNQVVDPFPSNASGSNRTMAYRLRVDLIGPSPPRSVLLDPGVPLECYATSISVALLGPNGASEVNAITAPGLLGSGYIVDTVIGCNIYRIEESTGALDGVYSQMVNVPTSTALSIQIPTGARELTVYQADDETPPAATVAWGQYYGDPAIVTQSWRVGSVGFSTDKRQSIGGILLPGATHIRTDSIASERQFFLVWTIRP